MSTDRQVLPEGLAHMPPGAGLAAVLASVDRTRLYGADLYTLLRARAKQVAYEQAELLADCLEAAYTPGEGETLERVRELGEFSGDQRPSPSKPHPRLDRDRRRDRRQHRQIRQRISGVGH